MKNKTKLKKASNKAHQTFLTHSTSQPTDSKEIYQGNFESEVADSGRSMVEMLGVLAVVGVLSVGGILGYKYAMNKYQANQIVNELNLTSSQMAIMLIRPRVSDFELSLGDPYDGGHIATNALAFNFGCGAGGAEENANCARDDMEYFSEVRGVSEGVCQNLVQLVQNLPYLEDVLVNDLTDSTGVLCVENNTVRCLFNADKNTLIEDNPDPEVTETETDTGVCGPHAYYDDKLRGCLCEEEWYNSVDGFYYQVNTKGCPISQEKANEQFCNGKGTWKAIEAKGVGCNCIDGTYDDSNNNCSDNGGCCQNIETNTIETMTLTPEVTDSFTPEVTERGISCGEHAYLDEYGTCVCEAGWFSAEGKYYELVNMDTHRHDSIDCTMSQAKADEQFCNGNGTWGRSVWNGSTHGGCTCNNGLDDVSNNGCQDNGGCCKDVLNCASNSDCKSGEYCYVAADNCSEESANFRAGGCKTSSVITKEISGLGSVTISSYINWWNAERYCQAQGKHLFSLSDLGCATSAECSDSQIRKDLYSAFGSSNIWTSDQVGDNCNAYYVSLSGGYVSTYTRNNARYALCK